MSRFGAWGNSQRIAGIWCGLMTRDKPPQPLDIHAHSALDAARPPFCSGLGTHPNRRRLETASVYDRNFWKLGAVGRLQRRSSAGLHTRRRRQRAVHRRIC
jgi:hypothetical protein